MESTRLNIRKIFLIGLLVLVVLSAAIYFVNRESAIEVPAWAGFFSPQEWDYFRRLVIQYFDDKDLDINLDEEIGSVFLADGKELGLHNLAQECQEYYQSDWPIIVSDHFDAIFRFFAQSDELDRMAEDFIAVKSLLAVRIWPESYLQGNSSELVFREDLEGTATVLVFDLPDGITNVTRTQMQKWGVSEEELFQLGIQNVVEKYKPSISEEIWENDVRIWKFTSEDYFAASHILVLDEYPICVGDYGSLVAIPVRIEMLCYPIQSGDVIRAVNQMIVKAAEIEFTGPGSVTPNVYWYHEGEFTYLPYTVVEKKLIFLPPPEFTEMINKLAESE